MNQREMNEGHKTSRLRRILTRWWPVFLITGAAFAATPWLLGPRCPDHIVIATGSQDGAYYAFANEYKKILAEKGITLEIRTTSGSIENEQLLLDPNSGISLAMIQGGTAPKETPLESLASLYPEPVWVFQRAENPVEQLRELKGKRIGVGQSGSGTRAIALKLLADNEVDDKNQSTKFLALSPKEASQQLQSAEIDAAFFVMSPNSKIIQQLLNDPEIKAFHFERGAAYRQKYGFLAEVVLPQGIVDFQNNVPTRDIHLVAPTANLVVREDFHHALVPLLLEAVEQTHAKRGVLVQTSSFPTPRFTDYPLNTHADRYFQSGPSFLYRYFPFGVAAWLDRIKLILLPLCTLLIPLLKLAPPVYRWRIRSKIYRWYRVLHEVEQQMKDRELIYDRAAGVEKLQRIEQELMAVTVPLSYMEEFYNLRVHIEFVREQLAASVPTRSTDRRLAA